MNEKASATTSHRQLKRGISLLETAVTCCSVSFVLLLLLPALGEARREGKEVRCLTNLQRIGEASTVYAAADSKEHIIPVHPLIGNWTFGALGEYEWGGKSGRGDPEQGTSPVTSTWGTMMGRGPGARPLNNVLYKGGFYNAQSAPGPNQINWARDMAPELPEFHCPADYGYTGTHLPDWRDSKLTSYDHYGNSYAANTWWIAKRGPECELMSNSPFLHPLSTIPSPKRTIMYIENCGRFADLYNLGADGCQARSELTDELIRGWHGEPFTFNTAFVDGHASRLFIKGHLQPQLRIGRYPLCEDYDPDICYQVWHCGIVRGSTWQKDTLPTPPVETGIGCNYAVVSALVW